MNSGISSVIAEMGHTDLLVVCDCRRRFRRPFAGSIFLSRGVQESRRRSMRLPRIESRARTTLKNRRRIAKR